MKRESFPTILDQALHFVRLHGWVDQTGDQIDAVRAFFPAFPEGRGEFSALLIQRLAESRGTAEKLLTLVCLRSLGLPSEDLAELFFLHLGGKLEKRDQVTLQKYFFEGRSPLPQAVSGEITDRVYLTYHRALYRALHMQSFTSECDTPDTILFFVQMLCRNDVFEQNRAMVHLLLSRIDGPVPLFIQTIVSEALTRLGALIAEVENQGEAVLTQSHRDDAPLVERQRPSLANLQSPLSPEATPAPDSPRLAPSPPKPFVGWPGGALDATEVEELEEVEPWDDLPRTLAPVDPRSSPSRRSAVLPVKPTPRGSAAESRQEPVEAKPLLSSSRTPASAAMRPIEALPPNRVSNPSTETVSRAAALPSSARYEIRFNRGSPELETLLQVLQPTASEEPLVPEAEEAPGLPKPAKIGGSRWLPWWGWILIALVLITGWAFWGNRQSPGSVPPSGPAPVATPATVSNLGPVGPHTAVTAPGGRVWDFYQAQKASPAPLAWQPFLNSVKSLNPELKDPDLLLPGQVIQLP